MVAARGLAIVCAAAALGVGAPADGGVVEAKDYDTFWLWAGVRPQPVLRQAQRIYLLGGEVVAASPPRLIAQIAATPHIRHAEVWLVWRVETLDWTPRLYDQLFAQIGRWRAAGNTLAGVEIDFDARTHRLDRYAAFLKDLKARLPPDCRLGVTGLMDWSSGAEPAGLSAVGGVIDDLVLQTYQGRRTIPGYGAYLNRIAELRIPFRIGLIEGGEWTPPDALMRNPNFRGYVVFLRNP